MSESIVFYGVVCPPPLLAHRTVKTRHQADGGNHGGKMQSFMSLPFRPPIGLIHITVTGRPFSQLER